MVSFIMPLQIAIYWSLLFHYTCGSHSSLLCTRTHTAQTIFFNHKRLAGYASLYLAYVMKMILSNLIFTHSSYPTPIFNQSHYRPSDLWLHYCSNPSSSPSLNRPRELSIHQLATGISQSHSSASSASRPSFADLFSKKPEKEEPDPGNLRASCSPFPSFWLLSLSANHHGSLHRSCEKRRIKQRQP